MKSFFMSMSRLLVDSATLAATGEKVNEILKEIVSPIFIALGGAAVVYMIVLGVQFAKAEDDKGRLEIKKRILNVAIGLIVIILLITLCLSINWMRFVINTFGYLIGYEHY